MRRLSAFIGLTLLMVPLPASAIITFNQLDDDVFVVSHRIKGIGSRSRAMKLVYEKAASLCVAAGFSHYAVLEQESNATQEHEAANASVQVKFFFVDADDRLECKKTASAEYVSQAREKLMRAGYQAPERPTGSGAVAAAEAHNGSCTIEQIAAMAKAGLTDAQIKAACSTDDE